MTRIFLGKTNILKNIIKLINKSIIYTKQQTYIHDDININIRGHKYKLPLD